MSKYVDHARKVGLVDGPELIAGSMLLAAMGLGADIGKLAEALQTPAEDLEPYFTRYREQGVFTEDGMVNVDWLDDEDEDSRFVGFLCDVACGTGMLVRK